jgi:hypothetical protein
MDDYQKFRFSVTCQTDDEAVLHCLRALCQWAEEHAKPQIGWGGTTRSAWEKANHQFTLRFTAASHRQRFEQKADELLEGRWKIIAKSDHDPATRQRPPQ